MNRKRIMTFLIVIQGIWLLSCRGPLEHQIDEAYESYGKITSSGKADPEKLNKLLNDSLPLLSEKKYTHQRDLKLKKKLLYRDSLLISAIVYHLEDGKEIRDQSRSIFLNAYLLDRENAYRDLVKLLPEKADTEMYKYIEVPEYSAEKSVQEKSSSTNPDNKTIHIQANIHLKKRLPYYLLQLIGGDVLYKAKDENHKISSLGLNFLLEDKTGIATGYWDAENDELNVTLLKN